MAGHHGESPGRKARPAAAAAAPERRSAARLATLLRVAVLVRAGSRRLCLVRNISSGGLDLRIFCEVAAGEAVAIELRADRPLAGRIVWIRDGEAGLAFDRPVDVADALAPPPCRPGWRPRMPRIEVDRLAMIRSGSDISFASTRDISQGGVRLVCDRPLARGAEIVLTLEGFRPLAGVVRWSHDGYCGISFDRVIPPGDLSRWLAS